MLDLTRVLAGPFCTMNLADLGAEVIKIEMPGRGDDSRSFAPMMPSGDSGYFYSVNRGKRSVTLDLRIEDGAGIFLELAAKSDVVVENFSPGTMDRFKVGYAELEGRQSEDHSVLDFRIRADRAENFGARLRHRGAGARRHDEYHRQSGRRAGAMRRVGRRSCRRRSTA